MNFAVNPTIRFGLFALLWLSAVGVGMSVLLRYEFAPAPAISVPSAWPAGTRIPLSYTSPTLVMAVHPRCPCTRASIRELARILSRCGGKLRAIVLFLKPDELEQNWEKTDLRQSAISIPGVTVLSDRNGAEAARFHAEVSGETLLYSSTGQLLFSGGITAFRGHEGDNDGEDAVVSLVTTGKAKKVKTRAFGCSLLDTRTATERSGTHASR